MQIPSNKTEWINIGRYADYLLDDGEDEFYSANEWASEVYFKDVTKKLIKEQEAVELGLKSLEYSKYNTADVSKLEEAISNKYSTKGSKLN